MGDLQDALQLLVERKVARPDSGVRRELSAALKHERREQTYGTAPAYNPDTNSTTVLEVRF